MSTPTVKINVSGARGESYPDVLRRTGAYGVQPGDTDVQALSRPVENTLALAGGAANYRATRAQGVTDFPVGTFFSSAETGDLRIYKRIAGSPFYEDQGDTVAPATKTTIGRALPGRTSLEQFGGVADGTTLSRSALDQARATGLIVQVSGPFNIGPGLYDPGATVFEGVGPNARLIGGFIPNATGANVGTPIAIDFNDGTKTRSDTLADTYKRPYAEKNLWLGAGDQVAAKHVAVAPASLLLSINDYPGSDTWAIGAYGAVAATGIGFTPDTDLRWYAATIPVHGGMELNASISGVNLNRGVCVICTGGAFVFYASDFGQGSWSYKPTGGAAVTGTVDWSGRTSHESWIGKNMGWSSRFYDSQTIGVLINGMEVFRYKLPSGQIVRGGFMLMRTTTGATGSIEFVTASRVRAPQGAGPVSLAIYGDSKSAPYFGGWANSFREALDGTAGIRVTSVVNRAVSGQNSNDQLAVMTASPPTGCTDCLIHVGTNDIQQGATSDVTVTKIGQMIDLATANGCRVHLVVPDLWYTPALAGGFGETTVNYQGGARTRAAIMNLAASRGASVINLPQVLGPALGSQRTSVDASDPRLRDNIHPTAFAYRVVGMEIAKAVLRGAAREMRRAVPLTPLPGALQNGWTAGADAPSYTVSDEGQAHLSGYIVPGTKADGTVVYTLPRNLWPIASGKYPTWIGNGNFCMVDVAASNGQITLTGGTSALYLALDGITFQTASVFG